MNFPIIAAILTFTAKIRANSNPSDVSEKGITPDKVFQREQHSKSPLDRVLTEFIQAEREKLRKSNKSEGNDRNKVEGEEISHTKENDDLFTPYPTYSKECQLECGTTIKYKAHYAEKHDEDRIFASAVPGCKNTDHSRRHRAGKRRKAPKSKPVVECRECQRNFSSFIKLDGHFKTAHSGRKMYKCERCSAEFSQHKGLTRHERYVHESRKYFCEFCDKKYARADIRDRHKKICMTKENAMEEAAKRGCFRCVKCDEIFEKDRYNNYAWHLQRHGDFKKCPICSQRIVTNEFKIHVKKHEQYVELAESIRLTRENLNEFGETLSLPSEMDGINNSQSGLGIEDDLTIQQGKEFQTEDVIAEHFNEFEIQEMWDLLLESD